MGVVNADSSRRKAVKWYPGSDADSWGYWVEADKAHKGVDYKWGRKFGNGDVLKCEVDCDKGTLAYYVNDEYLGIAFDGIKFPVRPAISMAYNAKAMVID